MTQVPLINDIAEARALDELDGHLIEVVFARRDGPPLRVHASGPDLERMAGHLQAIAQLANARSQAGSDHDTVNAILVTDVIAGAPVGGGDGRVVMGLRLANGVSFAYALAIDLSKRLRTLLDAAETSSVEQTNAPRQ